VRYVAIAHVTMSESGGMQIVEQRRVRAHTYKDAAPALKSSVLRSAIEALFALP
jgi:hypothetical protein